jgi:hypothetical protein
MTKVKTRAVNPARNFTSIMIGFSHILAARRRASGIEIIPPALVRL